MNNISGKTIVITGASSGIGEATARVLAAQGANVVMGARRADRLEALANELVAAGAHASWRAIDVTELSDVEALVAQAKAEHGRVDVVINNAGVMPLSRLDAGKVDEWNRMIDVNIRGVLHGIAAGLPVMQAQGGGQFINVSSIGGHAVYPTSAVYSATKFAVLAMSEGLRQEHTDLRVTVVSPGVTTSELGHDISDAGTRAYMDDFRALAMPAEAIANAISYAIGQPEGVDVSEIIVRPTASPY